MICFCPLRQYKLTTVIPLYFQIDMMDLIKSCEIEGALQFLEQSFVLTEEKKRAVLQQKIMFWTNAMTEDLCRETGTPAGVVEDLMDNWSSEEKRQFNEDWANDDFLCWDDEAEQPHFPADEPLENQVGDGGKRKLSDSESPSKRQKPEEYFTVKSVKEVNVRKFKTTGTDYAVQFHDFNIHGVLNIMPTLNRAVKHLFDRLTTDMAPHDQVRLILNSHQLDKPISLPFMPKEKLTPERFLAAVERVVQSNDQFTLDDSVNVNVVHVEMPHGGARRRRDVVNLQSYLNKKQCFIQIKNKDELCCARAIIVAKAKLDQDPQFKSIVTPRGTLQGHLAYELHESAGVPLGSCGINEIKKFQAVLPGYQLNIVSKEHLNALIYSGPEAEKYLYLYHHDNHYDVITSMPAFLAWKQYCHKCKKGYEKITDHPCGDLCKLCNTQNCPVVNWTFCQDCNRFFKSDECFVRHKDASGQKKALCTSLTKCQRCQRVVTRASLNDHHCGLVRCTVCQKYVEPKNHQCYIQPIETRNRQAAQPSTNNEFLDDDFAVDGNDGGNDERGENLMFFDFECTQDDGQHIPNLCVVQNESGDEKVFLGSNTKDEFCEWLFAQENANTTFIAHNFQAYDGYFILQHLYKNGIVPEVITRGAKILSLTVPQLNIKFIDSLCFIPMRLASFPKTFGVTELEKGFFPHFFNRAENQDYVGPLPDAMYYDPEGMNPGDREKFYVWYNDLVNRDFVFDFQAEILRYCQSDVDILRRCCLEFRELFHSITDVDPFAQYLTIASAWNFVFRKTFLRENTIAIIPPCGYTPENKQSVIALKMLAYIAQHDDIVIRHARNHGEQRIGKYLVDGYNVETNTLWEIRGCLWHGCPKCYARDTVNPVNELSMHELHQRTLEKVLFLKDNGYNVIEIWTCDIDRQLAADPDMKRFFDNFEISEPLEPRQAFFGGRTNATRLFYETQSNEKIQYVDFCSLYPWCNKYGEYPLGHPKIITENFRPLNEYFGMVKCSVIPPRRLYHPVLPYRTQGKLMFPLCRNCADTLQQEPCHHTDADRTLHGTLVTFELEKALRKSYQLVKVDEVWHFPEHTDGLFKDYVDTFLTFRGLCCQRGYSAGSEPYYQESWSESAR